MSYYVMLSTDINGIFGPSATKQSIITMLKNYGKSDGAEFSDIGLTKEKKRTGTSKWIFSSSFALLLGAEKQSRAELVDALGEFFGPVDEIGLAQPRNKEWLACVTFVEPANAPTFQVIALVGSSAVQAAKVAWAQEDKPPKFWTTHVPDWTGKDTKKIFDLMRFNGLG